MYTNFLRRQSKSFTKRSLLNRIETIETWCHTQLSRNIYRVRNRQTSSWMPSLRPREDKDNTQNNKRKIPLVARDCAQRKVHLCLEDGNRKMDIRRMYQKATRQMTTRNFRDARNHDENYTLVYYYFVLKHEEENDWISTECSMLRIIFTINFMWHVTVAKSDQSDII